MNKLNPLAVMLPCVFVLLALAYGDAPEARAETNELFNHSHRIPSPRTLRGGSLVYGTQLAYGVTDFLQVGTDLISDFFKVINVGAKASLIDVPAFALSPFLAFETYNYHDIVDTNPDIRVNSYLPGLVTATALGDALALFVAGNLNLSRSNLVTEGIERSGWVRGAVISSDLSWAYNQPGVSSTKKNKEQTPRSGIGNVLATGVSYDINYKLFGVGVSHHWPGFHIGVHYFPAADRYKLQPIVAGGGTLSF